MKEFVEGTGGYLFPHKVWTHEGTFRVHLSLNHPDARWVTRNGEPFQVTNLTMEFHQSSPNNGWQLIMVLTDAREWHGLAGFRATEWHLPRETRAADPVSALPDWIQDFANCYVPYEGP